MAPKLANCCTVLTTLGYTEREAAFLRLVAMHSGVFLRRQYIAYTGGGQGKAVHGFIAKLVTKRHGRPISYGDGKTLYHLTNKRLYRVLGIEDSNNRRNRGDVTLKARLMAVDFILAHADARFLETEREKIAFFRDHYGARIEQMPAINYPSLSHAGRASRRFFVEKFPIFIVADEPAASDSGTPEVAFSFVDDGQVTVSSFAGFLARYAPLMRLIPSFRLYYITDTPTKIAPAERQFERQIAAAEGGDNALSVKQAQRFRELMARWQEGKTNFSSEEFAELARLRRAFDRPRSCPAASPAALAGAPAEPASMASKHNARFIAFPLRDQYHFAGELCQARSQVGDRSPSRSLAPSPRLSPGSATQTALAEWLTGASANEAGQEAGLGAVKTPAGNDPASAGFGLLSQSNVSSRPGGTSRSRQGSVAPNPGAEAAPNLGAVPAPDQTKR